MNAPSRREIEAAAAAIANARINRNGSPSIINVLEILPEKLRAEVMEEAELALKAAQFARGEPVHAASVKPQSRATGAGKGSL